VSDDLEPLSPEEGVERFLKHREPSVRKSTLQNARTRLHYFQEWCREREIENLNTLSGRDLADFVAWRRDDLAPITLQKQLSTIRVFLEYCADIEAVEDGLREKVHAPELPDGAESRDVHLDTERAEFILGELDRYHYASRRHVVVALLWRTGMRRGALRALDVDDLQPDDHAIDLKHRSDEGTALKNGEGGERWVYLGPKVYQIIDDYLNNPERPDVTDSEGRQPLITTNQGRASESTVYDTVHRATQPCRYGDGDCPHDRDPENCEAIGSANVPSKCPSSRSPHAIRRGRITRDLNDEVPPEVVSERADVSLDVLYEHYDARSPREKMDIRKQHYENES
jgi:site-specific recombinase XerD